MDRREWLKGSLQLMLLLLAESYAPRLRARSTSNTKKAYLVASRADVQPPKTKLPGFAGVPVYQTKDVPGYISVYDCETRLAQSFELPIAAHVFNQHPQQVELVLGAVKWSPSAVVFNLKEKKQVSLIQAPGNHIFFGHACFHPQGKIAYLSANSTKAERGALCLYDCQTWKLLDIVHSGGFKPHECLLNSQSEICVVNENNAEKGEGSLVILDPDTLKAKKSFPVPNVAHISSIDDRRYVLSGGDSSRDAEVIQVDTQDGHVLNFKNSADYPAKKILSEGLSICVITPDLAVVSLVDAQALLVWRISSNRFKMIPSSGPVLGVAKKDQSIFVTSGKTGILSEYRVNSTQDDIVPVHTSPAFANGRHMRLMWF